MPVVGGLSVRPEKQTGGGATDQAKGLTKMESSIPFRLASYS